MSICLFGGILAMAVHGVVDHEYNDIVLWFYLAMTAATFALTLRNGIKPVEYRL